MGINLSRIPLTLFEIVNELFIAVGSGIPGLFILGRHGISTNRYFATCFICSITTMSLVYAFNTHELSSPDRHKIVLITGCDSGLGYSLAMHATEMGFTVLAGCFNLTSEGARKLSSLKDIKEFELDITSMDSVKKAVWFTKKVLDEDENNLLWAVINNAGVMVFGEFEWQTEKLIQLQLGINLMGTMRFTNAFCYLLRNYRCRLINISSHCALATLPGLSVYGATKAAIQGFNDALRIEMSKYGVPVISFIPGSFMTQSNIMSKQTDFVYEMRSAFTKEQEAFYGQYFINYNSYLSAITAPTYMKKIVDADLYQQYEHALLSKTPRMIYKVEPFRYFIYHLLFKISPLVLRDYFIEKFMQMPEYVPKDTLITKTLE